MTVPALEPLLERIDALFHDLHFNGVKEWKAAKAGRKVIGYLPVYVPQELITAAGMHPLGIVGGGDQIEIIRGDAYFQSYICHIPRSVVEMGVSGRLDVCDGFLFPSTCDVIRNLSGIWKLEYPDKYVKYVDVPQNFDPALGGEWWRHELEGIRKDLTELGADVKISDEDVWQAIGLHEDNRAAMRDLYDYRAEEPWKALTAEVYLVQRAGLVLPVEEHTALIRDYIAAVRVADRPMRDHSRIVVTGTFCEQPPLDMLRTLERAGCYIVDDDLLLGPRFLTGPVDPEKKREGDPLLALSTAFLEHGAKTSFIYIDEAEKGAALADTVEERNAEGVIFCAPSFCDPALLDRPMLASALDKRGVAHIALKYSENTGQFQTIREQAGTFADALKLWSEA